MLTYILLVGISTLLAFSILNGLYFKRNGKNIAGIKIKKEMASYKKFSVLSDQRTLIGLTLLLISIVWLTVKLGIRLYEDQADVAWLLVAIPLFAVLILVITSINVRRHEGS